MKSLISTLGALLGLLVFALPIQAQSGLVFSTSAEATALHYNNTWGVATHTTESLDLIDWGASKGNALSIEGHQIVAGPAFGFNSYLGGVRVTPDISALIKKTNLPADSFQVFAQGALGVSPFASGSQFTYLAGGGVSYRLNTALQLSTLDVHWLRVGTQNSWEVSSGLTYFFNPQASQSMAVKRMFLRRAALKSCR